MTNEFFETGEFETKEREIFSPIYISIEVLQLNRISGRSM